jgi:hypothetical protein
VQKAEKDYLLNRPQSWPIFPIMAGLDHDEITEKSNRKKE